MEAESSTKVCELGNRFWTCLAFLIIRKGNTKSEGVFSLSFISVEEFTKVGALEAPLVCFWAILVELCLEAVRWAIKRFVGCYWWNWSWLANYWPNKVCRLQIIGHVNLPLNLKHLSHIAEAELDIPSTWRVVRSGHVIDGGIVYREFNVERYPNVAVIL